MAELVVYPDADPETTSVDGEVGHRISGGDTWATIQGGAGNRSDDDGTGAYAIISSAADNKWQSIYRVILLFDTSDLPEDCEITGAILSVYGGYKEDAGGIVPALNVYTSDPATNTALVPGDYDRLGIIALCDAPITYAEFNASGWNHFTLNAAGLAAISKTGITKLGLRESNYDAPNVEPTWSYCDDGGFFIYNAEEGEGYKPKLTITYELPPVVVAPTVTTEPATLISQVSATPNGTLDDDGGEACGCGFEWGETEAYEHGATSPQSKTTGEDFSRAISGLSPGTTYHFRAFATNSAGTGYGADRTFTTLPVAYKGNININQLIYQHAERMAR